MVGMKRDMDINVNINSEVTRIFTKRCRSNGFLAINVLKYIVENRKILDDLCIQIFQDEERYLKAVRYQNKVKQLPKNNSTPYTLRDVESEFTLKEILRQNGISVVFFFCYLASNQNVINFICSKIPSELKMKKYQ